MDNPSELRHICYYCFHWTPGPAPDRERLCALKMQPYDRPNRHYDDTCDNWGPNYHVEPPRSHHDGHLLEFDL